MSNIIIQELLASGQYLSLLSKSSDVNFDVTQEVLTNFKLSSLKEILLFLSKFNLNWWLKYTDKSQITIDTGLGLSSQIYFGYSSSLNSDKTLNSPSWYHGATSSIDVSPLKNNYFYFGDSANTTLDNRPYQGTSNISAKMTANTLHIYNVYTVPEEVLLSSTNRNQYPDSGTVDGYNYKYLGVPYDSLLRING